MKVTTLFNYCTLYWLSTSVALAEIVSDGTLGAAHKLSLSNETQAYAITQDLGKTVGNHLFHSFQTFNLAQGETAVFSGAAHVENVISRVTGGSPSNINGMIKNSIPGANTYLLNPSGIFLENTPVWICPGVFMPARLIIYKWRMGQDFILTYKQTVACQ